MGKIIKNSIPYGGSSNSAGNISYDNTSSGLTSSTVQNAITELKSLFDNSEHIRMIVVEELPSVASAEDNVVYLIDENSSGIYEEYIVAEIEGSRQFIKIGDNGGDSTDNLNQFLTFNATERDKGRITTPFTFKYLFIRNAGPDDCYISESDTFANVGEGKDGSVLLEAGSTIMLESVSGVYCVCNQGEIAWLSFCYQNNKNCPFDTY